MDNSKETFMAFYIIINTKVQAGKTAAERDALMATAKHLNASDNYVGIYEILTNVDGPLGGMNWYIRCDSLADFEYDLQQRRTDAKWDELFKDVVAAVDIGNTETHFYRIAEAAA